MADDDLYFLQPDFDLASLTVPRLRSILVSQNVSYPSSAKKQDLINIIRDEILPQSRKLLNAQARIKRTSRGIEDVPSSQEGDSDLMPPPPQPKTPRSRKSKTNLNDTDEVSNTTRRKTPSRSRSARKPKETDPEADSNHIPQSVKKTRKSIPAVVPVTGVVIQDSEYPPRKSLGAADSPFSDENPFQSGSSPSSGSRTVSRSRKSDISRKSAAKSRDSSINVKSETYEIPVSKLSTDQAGIETTEEFTPDAERELELEIASNKQLARFRSSTSQRKKPSSTAVKTAPFALLVAILGAIGSWYRREKINVGYCGIGDSNWSLVQNPNIPAWAHENLQPQCEPCPSHAICYPGMEARCEDDFVLQQHPLTFNGLIPLPPTCEPDSEKERRTKAVADRAVEELRARRAAYECGETVNRAIETTASEVEHSQASNVLEISEPALKKEVSKMRRKGMSSGEFEEYWKGALEDIMGREEVEVVHDGSRVLLSSTSLSRLPFICAVRRSLIRTISDNRIPIGALILVVAGLGYGRHRFISYSQTKAQTPSLVAMTLDRLATQAALKEDDRVQEGFISVGQLRDDVLRNVFSAQERERAWQRVRKIVEGNSNVRASTREGGKTGEWSRVWEWIGPVDLTPGLEGRRSGLIRGSPEEGNQHIEARKWNEGRPIY